MEPVKTAQSNFVYLGPSPDIGDLHCELVGEERIDSVWKPTPEELAFLIDGGNVLLSVWGHPMMPVALSVTGQQEAR
jgi:hypothetical protein